jgi:hypothetical protein
MGTLAALLERLVLVVAVSWLVGSALLTSALVDRATLLRQRGA